MGRLILLIFIHVILLNHGANAKGKKIFMDWEKFVDCPNFENKDIKSENVSVFRGDVTTLSLQGSFTVETDITTPPLMFTLAIDRQMPGGGAHRVLLYQVEDFCDKILQNGSDWEPYLRVLQPLPPETCPIYKQEYNVDGVTWDTEKVELKKDMVGKYTATLELFRPIEKPVEDSPPTPAPAPAPASAPAPAPAPAPESAPTPLTKFGCKILYFVIDTE